MKKRWMDLVGAVSLLALLFPILLMICVVNFLVYHRPPFFVHERIGKGGKGFKMLKFRTMVNSSSSIWDPKEDISRLTSVGVFLRNYSLDELPQLLNVLKGEMSLVGPRPLPMEYLPLFSKEQNKRHAIKPGITGWAQINGRNTVSWEQRFEMDLWYVENHTLMLDFAILWKTLSNLFDLKGINKSQNLTMEKFTGTKI